MKKMSGLFLALLLLVPTLASAGTIYLSTPTTSPVRGTISPKGYIFAANTGNTTFSVIPAAGYAIGTVTLDGVPLAATGLVAGGKSYSVANKAATQKVVAGFVVATTPTLAAKLSSPLSVAPGSPLLINGSASTISLPPTALNASYTWSVSPAGPVLSRTSGTTESSAGLSTTFTSASAGVYTVTLTLSAPGLTPSSASTSVVIQTPAILQSKACIDCHAGTQYLDYAGSLHANNPYEAVTCQLCHNPGLDLSHPGLAKGTEALDNVCVACHEPYNVQVTNYLKSSHYTSTHMKVYCASCHNPHSTVATYGAGSASTGCQTCHTPGSPYSIYSSNMVMKAPHGGGIVTPQPQTAPFRGKTQYVTQGLECKDCHAHDNQINAEWAEGGHGKNVNEADGIQHAWSHYDWSQASYKNTGDAGRNGSNCVRCHTAYGFIQMLGQNAGLDRLNPVSGQPNAVLACVGCHNTNIDTPGQNPLPRTPEGALRYDAYQSQIFSGYTAYYRARGVVSGPSTGQGAYAPGNRYVYSDKLRSNICIPCHSGRANGTLVKQVFADAGKNAWNGYSTVQTNMYAHAFQPVQNLYATGAYEYQSADVYAALKKPHASIETGAGADMGPCIGCHYTSTKPHSLEVVNATSQQLLSTECAKCHGSSFTYSTYEGLKSDWNASVAVLNALMSVNGLAVAERANKDMGFIPSVIGPAGLDRTAARGEQNYGAWYNWSFLTNADPNAFVHNPAYARQIMNDTVLYLGNGTVANPTKSVQDIVSALTARGSITAAQGQAANAYFTDKGCLGCHFGTSDADPVGIQRAPHYDYRSVNVPGNFTKPEFAAYTSAAKRSSQYYTLNNPCTACHTGNHANPQVTITHTQWAENGHALVNSQVWGAPATVGGTTGGTDFKVRGAAPGVTYTNSLTPSKVGVSDECVRCHTTTGFVNFATSSYVNIQAWGNAAVDKTKEVITCAACHTDAVGTVRSLDRWTAYVGYSAAGNARSGAAEVPAKFAFALPAGDLGKSNVCASCHSHGRNKAQVSGELVRQLNAFDSYSVARVSVTMTSGHGGAIAAVPFLTANEYVYKFAGKTYDLGLHGRIGTGNYAETGTGGACAGCHLGTDKTSAKGGHTFEAWKNFSSTTAGNQWGAKCYNCHVFYPERINSAGLNSAKLGAFAAQTSVKRVLRKSLNLTATTSLAPSATNPIRFYTNAGNFTKANRVNLQGANLNSIMPNNSWWLHGPVLAKQLLFDSLDMALDGQLDGTISNLTTDSGFRLTDDQINRAIAWFGGTTRPVPFNP